MNEYISKQRAKDLMGCCLASAKANYKAETSVFKKEQFKHYAETIEAMIDVVGAVESADVQHVKRGNWVQIGEQSAKCTECGGILKSNGIDKTGKALIFNAVYHYCPFCGARMIKDGEIDE